MAQTQFVVSGSGAGTDAITAQFSQVAAGALVTTNFFCAPFPCVLTRLEYSWGTAAGAASTWDLTKDSTGTAPGAGTSVLASTIDASTTANTPAAASLSGTPANLAFVQGDQLSIKVASGAASGSAKVIVTAYFIKS